MERATLDIEALAEICLQSAKTIKGFLASEGSGKLAFDAQALPLFPKGDEITQRSRNELRNAAKTLYEMITGPQECLMESSLLSVSFVLGYEYVFEGQAYRLPASIHRFYEIHLPL